MTFLAVGLDLGVGLGVGLGFGLGVGLGQGWVLCLQSVKARVILIGDNSFLGGLLRACLELCQIPIVTLYKSTEIFMVVF